MWKEVTSSSLNKVYTSVTSHSAKTLKKQRKRKATEEAKLKTRQSKYRQKDESSAAREAYSRHDDGITPDDITEDVSAGSLEQLKSRYYQSKVAVSTEQAKFIGGGLETRLTAMSGLQRDEKELWHLKQAVLQK